VAGASEEEVMHIAQDVRELVEDMRKASKSIGYRRFGRNCRR
jgi:hypothetical protein